jgi:hypothetical protein
MEERTQASGEERAAEMAAELARTKEELAAARRGHEVEMELVRARALDLETARMLVEARLAGLGEGEAVDVRGVVRGLREQKPYLFRADREALSVSRGVTATGVVRQGGSVAAAEASGAAREALETGERSALLRYMRARRMK